MIGRAAWKRELYVFAVRLTVLIAPAVLVNHLRAQTPAPTAADQLTVNGVNLKPIGKTIENGKKILQMQTDQTVKAIQKAISQ